MKGIVFNILEKVVADEYGEATWDTLLESAQLEGAYTAIGNYPDEDLVKLVSAASSALSVPADDVIRWFGRSAIPSFYDRYPQFFEGHTSARSFVLTINEIIHPEVRKLFPGADVPMFDFTTPSEDVLELGYVSHRHLCAFAEGLIEGAAAHFGEDVTIEQTNA